MGFLRWVKDHVARAAHTPVAILAELHHVSVVLWHVLTGLGTLVRGAWVVMLTGTRDLGYWVDSLAAVTYLRLRELFTVTIPAAIRGTLAAAWRRAAAAIGAVSTYAHAAYLAGLRYARHAVAELRGWATGAFRWTTGHIGDLLTRMRRVERRVFSLLDTPEHLAGWVFGALWRYTWRVARRYEVAIARWALRNAVGLALRNARDVESVLADIL